VAAFVVDASVVVEFLAPGKHGAAADRFIGGLAWDEPLELFAPDLILLEVANALRRLTDAKALSPAAADRAVHRLPQLAIAMVATGALLEEAWSLRRRMTIYDGAYAGLARALDRPLVTADKRLARACGTARIEAFMVDQPELVTVLDALGAND
jgi:predicted nucleic acid-binding protein